MNPYKDNEDTSFPSSVNFTYEDIATQLLKDHYFLTALELHTELVENGKELPQLREFFSNPGNFEQHVSRASEYSSMHRTPSQATLDSLDTARYSEDGAGDRGGSGGDVAVLEFELRKAKETIHSLRANLTQFADGESVLDKKSKGKSCEQRSLKPHERRAINFLINEYLLLQDYKLTSITFSDENPGQDFEDWDDVGLNMPRPSGLVSLFWGNSAILNTPKADVYTQVDVQMFADAECQINFDDDNVYAAGHADNENHWNHELLIQAEEIELLKQKVMFLETEKLNFQKLYDAAIISLNSLTSPTSETQGMIELQLPVDKLSSLQKVEQRIEANSLPCSAAENHYGSENSVHSVTPEQFEMIDSDKNSIIRKEGSNTSSFEPAVLDTSARDSPIRRSSVNTLDDTLSLNDASEWTRVQYDYTCVDNTGKDMWIDSGLPSSLKESILNWCYETLSLNEPTDNDLLTDLVNSEKPATLQGFLNLVADTLPRVLPHTLVSRRGAACAALASACALLPAGSARRARLLHALLTLHKRPDDIQARDLCHATTLIVKWGGSGEVLSCIADLLTSRSSERKLLASQICVAIAPYVPIELCTSLLFSLVALMCESSEVDVRSLGLKATCLICPVADHKYGQLENLMFNFLKDPADKIVRDTVKVLVPVLARTALLIGKFSSELCCGIMKNLVKSSADSEWKNVILYIDILRILVLAKLCYLVNVQIVRDVTLQHCDISINLQEVPLAREQANFVDLQCYLTDSTDVKMLLVSMNNLIKEKPDVRWSEISWFIDFVKQILDVATNSKALNHPAIYECLLSLFSSYSDNFGIYFVANILEPIFLNIILDMEHKMEKLLSVNVDSTVVVGIYLVTILSMDDDKTHKGEFFQKWIIYSSIRALPVKIFSIPLMWVSKHKSDTLHFYLQYLREFAEGSGSSASGAAVRIYIGTLITELVNTAELSEHCIEDQLLPALDALMHDTDVCVCESGITAWGALCCECESRALRCAERVFTAGERVLLVHLAHTMQSRVTRAAADALTHLLSIILTNAQHPLTDQAVVLVCGLCGVTASLSAECVPALTGALQLVVHHVPRHRALLPALRSLEEFVQKNPSLSQYKTSIEVLVNNVAGTVASASTATAADPSRDSAPRTPSNLQAAQEVGRRVTQIFQQSKTNMNLQNIFKKKT